MRVKACYSLCLDELVDEIPTAENLPSCFDGGVNLDIARHDCEHSLNIFKAFANYLVERNRTRDLSRQIYAAERALDARNAEARRQSEIVIANYAERLQAFLASKRAEFDLETQRLVAESTERVEQLQNEAERRHRENQARVKMLEFYRSFLDEAQKFLAEVEDSPEKFVTHNKFYWQACEDCRVKSNAIRHLLKQIDQ